MKDLHVKYGNIEVLHGIDLEVRRGEIVTILGANGAGKSTTLLTISGLVKTSSGGIFLESSPIHTLPAHQVVRLGIAQVPEGRRVFGTLTVLENLNLGAFTRDNDTKTRTTLDWIFTMFPILAQRRSQLAGTLSGGEQQMLAIGRALMARPELLLLDEPSMGLAPFLVRLILDTLAALKERGMTVLLVEQNAAAALQIADRGYVMENGRIVLDGPASDLLADQDVKRAYLGKDYREFYEGRA